MATAGKTLSVHISFGTILKVILAGLLFFLFYQLLDLVLVILVSIIIASAIEPATRWFGRFRVPRVLAVLTVYVIAFFLFAVLVPFFIFPIVADLSELVVSLPATLSNLPLFANVPSALAGLAERFSPADLFSGLSGSLTQIPRGVGETAGLIFGSLFRLLLIIVISFYLAVQPRGIESFLRLVTPLSHEGYILGLWQRTQRKIGMWMQGQILLGLVVGILVFLGLTIFRVKHALVLALLAALFELIPFFGPVLAAVPAVLIAFSTSTTLGFMIIGFYIIMQQFENHLIYPLVVQKIVGVPPLLVILSLLIGAKLAGFMGLILAVPLATVLMELLSDFEKSKYLFRKANG